MLHIVYSIQYLQLKPYVRMWPKTTLTTLKFKILWQVSAVSTIQMHLQYRPWLCLKFYLGIFVIHNEVF